LKLHKIYCITILWYQFLTQKYVENYINLYSKLTGTLT
jgi:hypothetical protein